VGGTLTNLLLSSLTAQCPCRSDTPFRCPVSGACVRSPALCTGDPGPRCPGPSAAYRRAPLRRTVLRSVARTTLCSLCIISTCLAPSPSPPLPGVLSRPQRMDQLHGVLAAMLGWQLRSFVLRMPVPARAPLPLRRPHLRRRPPSLRPRRLRTPWRCLRRTPRSGRPSSLPPVRRGNGAGVVGGAGRARVPA